MSSSVYLELQTRRQFALSRALCCCQCWLGSRPPGVLLYTAQCESLSCRMDEKCGTWGRASGRIFPRRKWPNNCIHIMPVPEAKYTEESKMCRIRIVWRGDVSLGGVAPAGRPTATRGIHSENFPKSRFPLTSHSTGLLVVFSLPRN